MTQEILLAQTLSSQGGNLDTCVSCTAGKELLAKVNKTMIKLQDTEGRTLLHHTILGIYADDAFSLVSKLLSLGANPNIEDRDGNTPLKLLCKAIATNATKNDMIYKRLGKAFVFLIGAGANISNNSGKTCFDQLNEAEIKTVLNFTANILNFNRMNPLTYDRKIALNRSYKNNFEVVHKALTNLCEVITKEQLDLDECFKKLEEFNAKIMQHGVSYNRNIIKIMHFCASLCEFIAEKFKINKFQTLAHNIRENISCKKEVQTIRAINKFTNMALSNLSSTAFTR